MARVLVSWSGGKDGAWALAQAQAQGHHILGLLTTISLSTGRVTMHGVRRELIWRQAQALGLPVEEVLLPAADPRCPTESCPLAGLVPNSTYEQVWGAKVAEAAAKGVEGVVFGDIHLEELRQFRDQLLARCGLKGYYPLWGKDSRQVVEEFLQAGGKAVVACVQESLLALELLGEEVSAWHLKALPPSVDPAGERGEYHTFVVWAPGFAHGVPVHMGERVVRDGFAFVDLLPA